MQFLIALQISAKPKGPWEARILINIPLAGL